MPSLKLPNNPNFSSGPCAKRPGWDGKFIHKALLGKSHRNTQSVLRIQAVIENIKSLLNIPNEYKVAIVGGSDTGAFEMALWSLLGNKPINILAWESFGRDWVKDVINQLQIKDTKIIDADYGYLPDLSSVNFNNDVIFTWNGTTSGVKVPNGVFALTVEDLIKKAKHLNTDKYVLKAQIHAGGRGKAGGVKILNNIDELTKASKELLGKKLITPQTGPEGREV